MQDFFNARFGVPVFIKPTFRKWSLMWYKYLKNTMRKNQAKAKNFINDFEILAKTYNSVAFKQRITYAIELCQ